MCYYVDLVPGSLQGCPTSLPLAAPWLGGGGGGGGISGWPASLPVHRDAASSLLRWVQTAGNRRREQLLPVGAPPSGAALHNAHELLRGRWGRLVASHTFTAPRARL